MKKVHIKQFGGKNRSFKAGYGVSERSNFSDSDENTGTTPNLENVSDEDMIRLSADAQDVAEIIKEGFNTLSDIQREVISLLISEPDMTLRKVAGIVGKPFNTVQTHYRRAKEKLRKYVLQNAGESIVYVESMLRRMENDKAETD